jgi:hypothetical protein
MSNNVNKALTMLNHIKNTIPKDLPHQWDPDYLPIKFIDALDNRISLPFELCNNLEVHAPS